MKEGKITKKPHPTGSLARRVLLVSVLLLAIPLFLETLFLYRQEYKQKFKDTQEILFVLAKEREGIIQQTILSNWNILEIASSDPGKYGKQWKIESLPLQTQVADQFTLSSRRREALLVGRKMSSQRALVIAVPFSQLIQRMAEEKDSPYPIRMAIVGPDNKVLAQNMAPRSDDSDLLMVKEPIENTDLTLDLTIPPDLIRELQKKNYYFRLASILFFFGVIGGGAVYWLTRRIAKPLQELSKTMLRVGEGAVHARYSPDWMGFEINALGEQFNETLDAMLKHQQEAEKERLHRERLAEELKIGHEIQKSLLPESLPEMSNLDAGAAYLPALEVSGDFYDLFQLENGSLLIAVADTAGKGISACLYSLGLRSMIRALATKSSDLAAIVRGANDLFWLDARNTGMFVTAWIGIYDPKEKSLEFCSQGHPPALLVRENRIEELWTEGIALGAQQIDSVPVSRKTLHQGDLLAIYTDGIIEAHDPDNQLYGKKRLKETLLHKKTKAAQEISGGLLQDAQRFSGGAIQHDDMTAVVLRVL